ncbi:hydroxymethylpyrimidine/phosphomethylpyrimidine kinase [Herbaspirillum sp. YR522]|uniref:bifunctional hydroxymethylpyrimidine kinase/phosphomethylpyrimidine kinase n=1 Tax=Herbaspirillum sp. YR522 TaxID=1144342 RepID=UPI00026F8869|nr:hydroxymethylpyrimidine/phosphomethylpyrimidine kinase [Herbaspirillum sp. YR522]EJN02878.1 hydroxymethylpyrimidine/phosphomethylpyrimidine kinase [Herbaspirillum sp. YR522]
MQNQTSPLILTFGAADPVGATGIQADLATFAAMGCHGLSVVTSLLIGDTARTEDVQVIDVDWVADQARVILEDMAVGAFKVGAVGSLENISVIAEIVSDYPDVPLILDPFTSSLAGHEEEEDLVIAVRELLIPQATLVLVSASELTRLAETWREPVPGQALELDAARIIEMGCEYLFVTNTQTDLQEVSNSLFDISGLVRQDTRPRLPGSFTGAGATLSAGIAAMLANGLEAPQAVAEAQEFTLAALANAQRLGMGKLVPDRYFWAREADEPGAPN